MNGSKDVSVLLLGKRGTYVDDGSSDVLEEALLLRRHYDCLHYHYADESEVVPHHLRQTEDPAAADLQSQA